MLKAEFKFSQLNNVFIYDTLSVSQQNICGLGQDSSPLLFN